MLLVARFQIVFESPILIFKPINRHKHRCIFYAQNFNEKHFLHPYILYLPSLLISFNFLLPPLFILQQNPTNLVLEPDFKPSNIFPKILPWQQILSLACIQLCPKSNAHFHVWELWILEYPNEGLIISQDLWDLIDEGYQEPKNAEILPTWTTTTKKAYRQDIQRDAWAVFFFQ